jgi:hypothetical protein
MRVLLLIPLLLGTSSISKYKIHPYSEGDITVTQKPFGAICVTVMAPSERNILMKKERGRGTRGRGKVTL